MAEPREPRDPALQAWIDRQLKDAPRLGDNPERAARIARALGLTAPSKDRRRARQ